MLEIIQAGSALVLRLSLRTFRKKRVEVNETVQWLEKVINSTLLETKFWKIIVSLDAMMHVKFYLNRVSPFLQEQVKLSLT
jgi:hypothetical protein